MIKTLKDLGSERSFYVPMDISSSESIEKAFHQVLEKFENKLDGLVNNAGLTKDKLALRMSVKDFDDVVKTNLYGSFECTKKAVSAMLKPKTGSIVNISSVIAHLGNAGQANYGASKAGLEGLSRCIAREVASRNIRINCVAPGYIETEMTAQLSEDVKDLLKAQIPMKAIGHPEQVAHCVSFLLSEKSNYMTGQTLHVNGGMYM